MTEIEKKEIKEMVNIMGKATKTNLCHKDCFIDTEFYNECSLCRSATALYNAGYRKQSDTVKEFAEMLKSEMKGLTTVIKEIDKIAAEFGKED